MKKARKGFTLVELLIVVAILGILSVSMMMAVGGTTAKAKASMIAANFDAARISAAAYFAAHIGDPELGTVSPDTIVAENLTGWADLKNSEKHLIYYGTGGSNIATLFVSADFNNDPSSSDIVTALARYPKITTADGKASMDIAPTKKD